MNKYILYKKIYILGKNRNIYKKEGSNKQYLKNKGVMITISKYKKIEKEKLKKLKEKIKEKVKLKKQKQKEKEKLKKLKEKEKLKKLKEKEKIKKNRKNIYLKGGMITTRQMSQEINSILQSWVREDDADDYFENWFNSLNLLSEMSSHDEISKQINKKLFSILNYNMLTELQIIKDLIYDETLLKLNFREIQNKLSNYDFLAKLMDTIDNYVNDSENLQEHHKIILFYGIIKNLINIYILLSNNIFNITIFKSIRDRDRDRNRNRDRDRDIDRERERDRDRDRDRDIDRDRERDRSRDRDRQTDRDRNTKRDRSRSRSRSRSRENKKLQLFRSWRREDQLNNIKLRNNFPNANKLLKIDNYLSTSTDKNLALNFYHKSSARINNFTLWQIDIPDSYPNLHVCHELKEVLLHIGAILEYLGEELVEEYIGDKKYNYRIEKYRYVGFSNETLKETINKYNKVLLKLEKCIKK
tara:strand:+ start:176 stop:1588 length:1413 start_codon:yes stop_codon:yes gene_type:complete